MHMKSLVLAVMIAMSGTALAVDTTLLPNQPDASTGTGTLTNTPGATITPTSNAGVATVTTNATTGVVTTTVSTKTFAPVVLPGTTQGTYGGDGGVSGPGSTYSSTKVVTTSASTDGTIPAGSTTTVTAGGYGTGIANTDHDFVNKKYGTGNTTSVGLCTFCHTPHKASTTLLLWNHTMSANTFSWDVAATTAGTALPAFSDGTFKGPSVKCLACHDGSVAIGDIGWFGENARQGGANLNNYNMLAKPSKLVGQSGNLSGTHPVAIPYPLNGAPNVYNGSTTGARLAMNDFVGDPTTNNMRLYSDVGGGQIIGKAQSGKTGIECSSCHDPHNKAAVDKYFLRGMMVGSKQSDGYICLQCHIK